MPRMEFRKQLYLYFFNYFPNLSNPNTVNQNLFVKAMQFNY